MVRFSIIIPIYNVESYIARCLESLYNQNLPEDLYEVIAVNDGTPDNSMLIVNEFALKHKNLRILEKENGGVSSARNLGIRKALYEYVTFIDPDDEIYPGSLYQIHEELLKCKVDMFIVKSMKENLSGDVLECYKWNHLFKNGTICSGINAFDQGYSRGSVWGIFYNLNFLRRYSIKFPVGIRNGEDTIFFAICQAFTMKMCFFDIPFYFVLERVGSASSITNRMVYGMKKNLDFVDRLRHDNRFNRKQRKIIEYLIYGMISNITYCAIRGSSMTCKEVIRHIDFNSYLPINTMEFMSLNMKINILNFSYKMFYYLCAIKYRVLKAK